MLTSDTVCATVGGVPQNAIRIVVTDPSGGTLLEQFIGSNGAPIAPDSWTAGPCTTSRYMADQVLCDFGATAPGGGPVQFLRKYVQSLDATNQAQVNSFRDFTLAGAAYTTVGPVGQCGGPDTEVVELCDVQAGGAVVPFVRVLTYDATGTLVSAEDQDAGGAPYVPAGVVTVCALIESDQSVLCDDNGAFLRTVLRAGGLPVAVVDTALDAVTPYVPVGTVGVCAESCDPVTTTGLCLADGTPIGVVTRRDCDTGVLTQDGWVNLLTGTFTAGAPPVGTMACGASQSVQVSGIFCDVDGNGDVQGLVLIEYHYAPDGTIESVRLVDAVTGATYVPVGTVTTCPADVDQPDADLVILCDVQANGTAVPFVRDFRRDELNAITGFTNYTLAGAPYVPTGTVGQCQPRDSESVILCDSAANPNRFIRTYTYNAAGAIIAATDTTLAGAPFVPTGAVGVCAQTVQSDTDFVEEVLCDSNGTAFIRLFRFNSTTGVLISTTNTTLAGAAFAPVGAVGVCSDCCPNVVGEGCSNTGSGRYTAIRATNGTITLIDSVSGATITAANIVPCPSDDTPVTLTAQHRLVGDADAPWTPGADVTGTLTSVTLTVISGTATVLDASGDSASLPAGLTATWNAEDSDTLTGPQSIDAVGGQVYVHWTQK